MKIGILGFGREGRAIRKYLKNNKAYKNAFIFILDKNSQIKTPHGTTLISGENYLENLSGFDLIFRSPGIPYNSLEIQNAVRTGVRLSSGTQIFFNEAPCKIIGVTGTKGKGTTSTLLYNIFKAAKKDVYLAGNIGKPAIEILPKLKKSSIVILELSSFQLHDLKKSPNIGVILDIFPDHMDSHTDFTDYFNAKSSIAKYQTAKDKIFYFSDNDYSKKMSAIGNGIKIGVSQNEFDLFAQKDLMIPGPHNFKNAVMASMVALDFGISRSVIINTVKKFRGLTHRLELIRRLPIILPITHLIRTNVVYDKTKKKKKEKAEIKFYNDSAGTNPETASAATRAFTEPIILIAGGRDKNLDYAPLTQSIQASPNLRSIILLGENKNKIASAIQNSGKPIIFADNLKSAVNLAYKEAKKNIQIGDHLISVVFSPGSASFDMFRDYADRGEAFRKLVKALKK